MKPKSPEISNTTIGALSIVGFILFGIPLCIALSGYLYGVAGNAFWFFIESWRAY